MKKVLVGLGLLLLVLVVVGYFFGPTLFPRFFPPAASGEDSSPQARSGEANARGVTPWGKITKVEAMDSFQEDGMPTPIRPQRGHQPWVVRLSPSTVPPPPPAAEKRPVPLEASPREDMEQSFLVDTTGEKHPFYWGRLAVQSKPTDDPGWVTLESRVELMVYSVPRDRKPRSLQLGDSSVVELP